MKREIKFRIWWTFYKKWRYFDILYGESEACTLQDCDEKTLSLFTGLLDKNGKEIYEGDIVKFWTSSTRNTKEGIIEIVKWDESGMWIPFRDDSYIQDEQGDSFEGNKGFEIIGNIYETPELLNKK